MKDPDGGIYFGDMISCLAKSLAPSVKSYCNISSEDWVTALQCHVRLRGCFRDYAKDKRAKITELVNITFKVRKYKFLLEIKIIFYRILISLFLIRNFFIF